MALPTWVKRGILIRISGLLSSHMGQYRALQGVLRGGPPPFQLRQSIVIESMDEAILSRTDEVTNSLVFVDVVGPKRIQDAFTKFFDPVVFSGDNQLDDVVDLSITSAKRGYVSFNMNYRK